MTEMRGCCASDCGSLRLKQWEDLAGKLLEENQQLIKADRVYQQELDNLRVTLSECNCLIDKCNDLLYSMEAEVWYHRKNGGVD